MKRCKHCGTEKSLDDFYTLKNSRDGRRPECKDCNNARRKEHYRANPQANVHRAVRWQRENPERYKEKQREYAGSGKEKISDRRSYLKRTYGLTVEQYDEMLDTQGGGCAICAKPPRDDISLHVDHDHETGEIRGLLCFTCNNTLGDLGDSTERLQQIEEYLDRDEALTALVRERAGLLTTSP